MLTKGMFGSFVGAILGAAAGWYWAGGAGWATAGILLLGGWLLPVVPCLLASRPIAAGLATNVMFGVATFVRNVVLYRQVGYPREQDWVVLGATVAVLAGQSFVVSVPPARARRRASQDSTRAS